MAVVARVDRARATAHGRDVALLAGRSVRRTLRQPVLIVPTIVFPLMLLAINTSGLASTTKIPGFPADSFLDFALVVTFMQGALFAATSAGSSLATDIETGFINRLALTPLRRAALLAGLLAGSGSLALVGAVTYLLVGLIAGASLQSGVLGGVVLIAFALFVALGFGAIGAIMALRTGSGEAVQGLFPLLFVLLFLSSMNMPRNLIAVHWFRTVATWNPISYLIEAMRSLVIIGWDATALARGFVVATALAAVSLTVAARLLRTRMTRT
jgi:ABC-2 type transport system permease protein